jgi:hypothetical protein
MNCDCKRRKRKQASLAQDSEAKRLEISLTKEITQPTVLREYSISAL